MQCAPHRLGSMSEANTKPVQAKPIMEVVEVHGSPVKLAGGEGDVASRETRAREGTEEPAPAQCAMLSDGVEGAPLLLSAQNGSRPQGVPEVDGVVALTLGNSGGPT